MRATLSRDGARPSPACSRDPRCLQQVPSIPTKPSQRGLAQQQAGNLEAAAEQYQLVLDARPDDKYANYNLGVHRAEQRSGARRGLLPDALDADPTFVPALFNLAILRTTGRGDPGGDRSLSQGHRGRVRLRRSLSQRWAPPTAMPARPSRRDEYINEALATRSHAREPPLHDARRRRASRTASDRRRPILAELHTVSLSPRLTLLRILLEPQTAGARPHNPVRGYLPRLSNEDASRSAARLRCLRGRVHSCQEARCPSRRRSSGSLS